MSLINPLTISLFGNAIGPFIGLGTYFLGKFHTEKLHTEQINSFDLATVTTRLTEVEHQNKTLSDENAALRLTNLELTKLLNDKADQLVKATETIAELKSRVSNIESNYQLLMELARHTATKP